MKCLRNTQPLILKLFQKRWSLTFYLEMAFFFFFFNLSFRKGLIDLQTQTLHFLSD